MTRDRFKLDPNEQLTRLRRFKLDPNEQLTQLRTEIRRISTKELRATVAALTVDAGVELITATGPDADDFWNIVEVDGGDSLLIQQWDDSASAFLARFKIVGKGTGLADEGDIILYDLDGAELVRWDQSNVRWQMAAGQGRIDFAGGSSSLTSIERVASFAADIVFEAESSGATSQDMSFGTDDDGGVMRTRIFIDGDGNLVFSDDSGVEVFRWDKTLGNWVFAALPDGIDHDLFSTVHTDVDETDTPADLDLLTHDIGSGNWNARPASAHGTHGGGSQYEFAHDFYIRPDGDDAKDGLTWANAWKTLLKAETGVSNADFARIYLSEGDHLINGDIPTFKDGIQIIGPVRASDRSNNLAKASARMTRTAAGNVSHYFEFLTTGFDNVYGNSVINIHFNVEKIDNYGIYAENANNGVIRGCAMTLDDTFAGAWHDKPMIRITGPSASGNDMSWWWIYDNFVEHCRLVYADADNGWLNGIQVGPNNIGITATNDRATKPYVHLKGRGGRNAVFHNMFEVDHSSNTDGAIFLEDLYQSYAYGNGGERLASNRMITLKHSTSCVISHAEGQSDLNGRVWEWDEIAATYDKVPSGFKLSTDIGGSGHTLQGNIYTISEQKAAI